MLYVYMQKEWADNDISVKKNLNVGITDWWISSPKVDNLKPHDTYLFLLIERLLMNIYNSR